MKKLFSIILLFATLSSVAQKKDYRWKYITNKHLTLLKNNVTRTGIVYRVYSEADGDTHVVLRLPDSSHLVTEIICSRPVPQCQGYTNVIQKPKIGNKVRIMGDWVWDAEHKWYEIHPVKKLTVL